jgi:DNA-directed RNA polymerase subunit H (RpoH/RPB5)
MSGSNSNSNSHITSIYNSRKNILEILKDRGYDIDSYENFTINEVGLMLDSDQLDMLIEKTTTKKKIYVKYYVGKVLKTQNIYDMHQDLFHLDNVLTVRDDLIVITKDEPNDTLRQNLKDIWNDEGTYISLINIKRLQFNVLKHELQPKFRKLTVNEKEEFKVKYNILHDKQIPDISYFSPVSLVLGFRPGDVIHCLRTSRTAIETNFYRICSI